MPRSNALRPGSRSLDARTGGQPGRHRAGPAGPSSSGSSYSGRTRWAAGVGATVVVVGTLVAGASPASATISAFGPIDPASNFPAYYTDGNGLSLAMCEDGGTLCLSGPEKIQDVHATPGADAEAFYYVADAQTPTFVLHNALEAAYAGDGADQEVVFMRTQVTARSGGLVAGATYNVKDPYGEFTCVAEAGGVISQNACRLETEPVAGEFDRALGGRIGPFLTRDPAAPAPPAGYLGALEDYTKVIGSPTGFNAFRVSGPGLSGTCTDTDGTTIQNCEQTDQFFLLGKIVDLGVPSASVSQGALDFGDVPATPAVTKTLTYANTGTQPVSIASIALGGADAAAFAQTTTCPTGTEVLAAGARCTIDVTFTPRAGLASAATLRIDDDTPADVRTIALRGANLGVMVVSDPVPPAGLAFGTVPVKSTSLEDNVVISNTGNGPLTVSTIALTGASAAHYRLGPNNTCGTPVAPDSGCEIGVQFAPTTAGSKSANLRVTDSNGKVVNVPLSGTGSSDVVVPTAPTLTATRTGTTADLSWTAATDNIEVTGYQVFRNGVQTGADLPATTRTFSDTGLAMGTYSYTVKALDAAGNVSPASNAQSVTVPDTEAPAAPVLTGSVSGSTVSLSWTAPTDNVGVTGYRVLRNGAQVGTTTATTRTFSQTGLASGTHGYTVRAVDAAGNVSPDSNTQSLTVAQAPNPAPTVTARAPGLNATAVPVANNVTATFSEAVNGVSGTTFRLHAGTVTGPVVAAGVTRNGTTNQWILNPSANLAADTRYTVELIGGTTAIRDVPGAALVGTTAQPLTWSFTTGPAPTITARTPGSGATGASRTANVTATFSESVSGVSGTTFTLRNAGTGATVSAVVSYNTTTRVATLNPSVTALGPNTRYTATLTTGIRDAAGNAVTGTLSWSFTTGT